MKVSDLVNFRRIRNKSRKKANDMGLEKRMMTVIEFKDTFRLDALSDFYNKGFLEHNIDKDTSEVLSDHIACLRLVIQLEEIIKKGIEDVIKEIK